VGRHRQRETFSLLVFGVQPCVHSVATVGYATVYFVSNVGATVGITVNVIETSSLSVFDAAATVDRDRQR
jgi:hypothetical protein